MALAEIWQEQCVLAERIGPSPAFPENGKAVGINPGLSLLESLQGREMRQEKKIWATIGLRAEISKGRTSEGRPFEPRATLPRRFKHLRRVSLSMAEQLRCQRVQESERKVFV